MSDIKGFDNKEYGANVWLTQLARHFRLKRRQKQNYIKFCSKIGHKKPSYFKHEWPDYICVRCGVKFSNPDPDYVQPPRPSFFKNLKDEDKPWKD